MLIIHVLVNMIECEWCIT